MSAQLAEAIFVFEMHWYWTVVVVINEKDKAQDLVYYLCMNRQPGDNA